jgi:hypothetical protein
MRGKHFLRADDGNLGFFALPRFGDAFEIVRNDGRDDVILFYSN